jgi:hypothetical protein
MESGHLSPGESLAETRLPRTFATAGQPLRIGPDPHSMVAILIDGRFSSGARCVRQSSQLAMS